MTFIFLIVTFLVAGTGFWDAFGDFPADALIFGGVFNYMTFFVAVGFYSAYFGGADLAFGASFFGVTAFFYSEAGLVFPWSLRAGLDDF